MDRQATAGPAHNRSLKNTSYSNKPLITMRSFAERAIIDILENITTV
jgi:hypothetical protein